MERNNINFKSFVKTIERLPNFAQRELLLAACLDENLVLCQACVDAKVDMKTENNYGVPFFCDYVQYDEAKPYVIDWLIEHGLDINYQGKSHNTPLKHACISGNYEIVKHLINRNAMFTKLCFGKNQDGEIYSTISCGSPKESMRFEIVKLLLESGAAFNPKENSRTNPIFAAIMNSFGAEYVKLFLQYGADSNFTVYGVPILSLAVRKGDFATVKLLLEKGAEVNKQLVNIAYTKAYNGSLNAIDIAISIGREDIQALLKEYGGIPSTNQEKIDFLLKNKKDNEALALASKLMQE